MRHDPHLKVPTAGQAQNFREALHPFSGSRDATWPELCAGQTTPTPKFLSTGQENRAYKGQAGRRGSWALARSWYPEFLYPFSWYFRWNSLPGRPHSTLEVLFRERNSYWMSKSCTIQSPAVSRWLVCTGKVASWTEVSGTCKLHTDFQGVSRKRRKCKMSY